MVNAATGRPAGVKRSSGSLVRLPVTVVVGSLAMTGVPSFEVVAGVAGQAAGGGSRQPRVNTTSVLARAGGVQVDAEHVRGDVGGDHHVGQFGFHVVPGAGAAGQPGPPPVGGGELPGFLGQREHLLNGQGGRVEVLAQPAGQARGDGRERGAGQPGRGGAVGGLPCDAAGGHVPLGQGDDGRVVVHGGCVSFKGRGRGVRGSGEGAEGGGGLAEKCPGGGPGRRPRWGFDHPHARRCRCRASRVAFSRFLRVAGMSRPASQSGSGAGGGSLATPGSGRCG